MGRPAFRAEERDAATPKRVLWILGVDPTRPPDGQITYSLGLIDALASVGTDITVVHLGAESPQQTAANSIVWHAGVAENRHRLSSVASRLPAMAFTAGSPKIR
jgi:hypothetical protein